MRDIHFYMSNMIVIIMKMHRKYLKSLTQLSLSRTRNKALIENKSLVHTCNIWLHSRLAYYFLNNLNSTLWDVRNCQIIIVSLKKKCLYTMEIFWNSYGSHWINLGDGSMLKLLFEETWEIINHCIKRWHPKLPFWIIH